MIPFFIAHTKYLTSDSIAFTWAGPDTYVQAHLANSFAPRQTLSFLVRRPIIVDVSSASSCHHMPLPISAVHHLPPYSPAQALTLARRCHCATPLRACPSCSLVSAPVGGDSGSRAPLTWRLLPGSKPRRLALAVQIFYRRCPPRSFSGLASPLGI